MIAPLPPILIRRIRIYRYSVYASLIGFAFCFAYVHLKDLSLWVATLVIIPALVHGAGSKRVYASHAVEAVATPSVLYLTQFPTDLVLGFTWLAVLSNASLWGLLSWPALTSLTTMALVLSQSVDYEMTTLAIICWSLGFVVLVYLQANHHIGGQTRLRERQADILRFLPEGFDPRAPERHERRWLTVAFVDLGGFTAAVERLAPEVTRDVLNRFLGQITESVHQAGGSVGKFLGDGVLCTFAPATTADRERSAERCLESMRALCEWLPDFNRTVQRSGCLLDFTISIGVASGYCSIGDWGSGSRRDFTVIGAPVNLACRLQNAVSDVELLIPLLVDRTTRNLIGEIENEHVFEVELKGLPNQIAFSPT